MTRRVADLWCTEALSGIRWEDVEPPDDDRLDDPASVTYAAKVSPSANSTPSRT